MKHFFPLLLLSALFPVLASAQCVHPVDSDYYNVPSAWTQHGAGNVSVTGGSCRFLNAADAVYDRVYRPLAYALSDTYFEAEFKLTLGANSANHGVGTNIIAFSAGPLDPISYDASQSYALTNQDGFIVELVSPTPYDNNVNNWDVVVDYKDGATRTTGANTISLSANYNVYYGVFIRSSATSTSVYLYTDAAHTQLFGQMTNTTVATVTGLNYLHHGVTTFGGASREFTGSVDDVVICDNDLSGIASVSSLAGFSLYPNPSADGRVRIDFNGHSPEYIFVYDARGALVTETRIAAGDNYAELLLGSGLYLVVLEENGIRYSYRQLAE